MSRLSQTLVTFKRKIEEAVALVPPMTAEDKLKAVQFWNVVSERLQEIVNNSAPEINALALLSEQQEEQQSLAPTQRHHQNECRSPQPTLPLMDRMTTDCSSDDKREYVPPFAGHQTVNDNSMISNTNSNHIPTQDYHQNGVSVESEDDTIDEHMASVITSYPNSVQTQQQMYANYSQDKESPELYEQIADRNPMQSSHPLATASATTSVIQEVDPNVMTSQRRNVIQSTQRAIEAIEKNLKNCCNDFETKSQMNANKSDNTCDETINYNNSNNLIKIIDTDESLAESSANNHIFNETSFDVSSYASSEEANEPQKSSKMDESLNDSSDTKEVSDSKAKKPKSVINSKKNNSEDKSEVNGKTDLKCNVCHKSFANNSALASHQWIHSKPYSCDYEECTARFSTKGNLLVHQRRHTGEKPFTCSHEGCTASFSTKGNLKRHIKAHSGERPWKCSQCDSRFTEKKSLKVHMRRHTGEKPYVCQVCGKSFSQTGVLQTHMALHLDERKHLCELCGKAFRQRSQLRLHVLRHEGVKRWDCTDCDAKFLTKGDLERHHRVHTGERPFVCDLCGKTFTRQQSLNEHSNRHLGLKPYSCTHCSKTFAEMSACYKHIKVHKKQQTADKNKCSAVVANSQKTNANEINGKAMKNTRSQVNVIQSTTSTAEQNNVLYRGQEIGSAEDSVISMNSANGSDSGQRLEFVEFGTIAVLANTSTQVV